MKEQQVNREDLPDYFKEMMEKESHHNHVILKWDDGTLYWKPSKGVDECMEKINLTDLISLFQSLGWGVNSEQMREFYRKKGYSLNGYWEIFYCENNNDKADSYRQYSLTPYMVK